MKRAAYRVIGKDFQNDFKAILIEDCNGPLSVTNDAEAVVEDLIASGYKDYRIIYKDSMGQWDELLHDGKRFVDFGPGYTPDCVA